jgi:hypothetical protein
MRRLLSCVRIVFGQNAASIIRGTAKNSGGRILVNTALTKNIEPQLSQTPPFSRKAQIRIVRTSFVSLGSLNPISAR